MKLNGLDLGQHTLFGPRIISSIGYNEQDIIKDILHLHCNGGPIDCDPTFSVGNFYNHKMPKPKHRFDKYPQARGVIEATSDNLPLPNESISTIMFDPPFVMGSPNYEDHKEGSSIIAKRFTKFNDFDELKEMYSGSLKEFSRVLKENGIVIFKCQDGVVSAKNHFTHCWVMYEALKIGFYPKDLFIYLSKNRLTDNRVQQHARKFHSYFWVFQKQKCRVEY